MKRRTESRVPYFLLVSVLALAVLSHVAYGEQSRTGCCDLGENTSFEAHIKNSQTGEIVQLPVQRQVVSSSVGTHVRTVEVRYTVEIPSYLLRSSSTTESRTDPSISYRLTLTQYYNDFYDGGIRYVAVTKYRGKWQSLDSQVRAIKGYLRAGVNGPKWGGGFLHKRQDSLHFTPGLSASKTLTPSWAGAYVAVSDYGFYQCGQIYAKLQRLPGRTWEFWFNICKGTIWPG